jgi:hypothetical protein
MDFEQALVYELNQITGLKDKVFPLGAKEGTEPPFVIYISSDGEGTYTLNGLIDDTQIECELHIIGKNYEEMKQFGLAVMEKVQAFFGRRIGIDGPLIKSFDYSAPLEMHIEELNFERMAFDIQIRV